MADIIRSIILIGVLLVLLGVVAGSAGGYQVVTNQCNSGYRLAVDQASQTTDLQRTEFANLSPTHQRIFLEAITASPHFSLTYGSTAPLENLTQSRVQYRNQTYVTNTVAADCGTPPGFFTLVSGGISLLLGVVSLLVGVAIIPRTSSVTE